jgi:hypothetical protein
LNTRLEANAVEGFSPIFTFRACHRVAIGRE